MQIAQYLRDEIRQRKLPHGSVLPGEAALCRQFEVSRSVARQALATLILEGVIRRDQGQPPVVAGQQEHRRLVQSSTGLYEQFASLGLSLQTEVLSFAVEPAPDNVAAFFKVSDVLAMRRLRSLDGSPIAYVKTWLPVERVPGLEAAHLENASLHNVLRTRYDLHPSRGRNRIRAVAADRQLERLLGVPAKSPLLKLEGEVCDQYGRPLESFVTWHRPENLVFDVDVHGEGETVQAAYADSALTTMTVEPRVPVQAGLLPSAPASLDEIERAIEHSLQLLQAAKLRLGSAT